MSTFTERFDAGEIVWENDQIVVMRVKASRERLVAGVREIMPALADEVAALNADR